MKYFFQNLGRWTDVFRSPFWFNANLDGNSVYTVVGDEMNNLIEFFNNTIGVKPSPASISELDPNKKYCAYAWLEATAAPPGTPGLLTQTTTGRRKENLI